MKNNNVAKHSHKFNKCKVYADQKKKAQKGYHKHKNSGYDLSALFSTFR